MVEKYQVPITGEGAYCKRSNYLLTVVLAMEGVAKGIKALNHKDTKAQRKPFLSAGRSLGRPEKTLYLRVFVVPFFSGAFATPSFMVEWFDLLRQALNGCKEKSPLLVFPPVHKERGYRIWQKLSIIPIFAPASVNACTHSECRFLVAMNNGVKTKQPPWMLAPPAIRAFRQPARPSWAAM